MPSTLTIVPWQDPIVDTIGYDPRTLYAETFWLPTLGPTALLLLRHLAARFDDAPDALELRVAETSRALGVGEREGSSSPIVRTLARLEQFDLACSDPTSPTIAVRRNLPPVDRRRLRRLPAGVQSVHAQWAEARLADPPHAAAKQRARRLALALLEEGDDPDHAERVLASTGFHPAVSHERGALGARPPPRRRRGGDPGRLTTGSSTGPRIRARIAALDIPGRDNGTVQTSPETVSGWLRESSCTVVLTGAGISTESGIPDFRGPDGVWTKNPAAEKTATLDYYVNDPEVRRQSWQNRLDGKYWTAEPNDGHHALVDLEHRAALNTLVTQNIDGLHHAAGTTPDKIVEIHGNVREVKCLSCAWRAPMAVALGRVRAGEEDPDCPECGGILKSATISFGENLVAADLARAQAAAARAEVFLAVGTTLSVYPAARLPEYALANRARLIIVNAEPTPFDPAADAVFRGQIGQVLPSIVAAL